MLQVSKNENSNQNYFRQQFQSTKEDGNFSIEVIKKALEVWSITLIPITNPDCIESRKNPL